MPRQAQCTPEFRQQAVKMVAGVRSSFESDQDAVDTVAVPEEAGIGATAQRWAFCARRALWHKAPALRVTG